MKYRVIIQPRARADLDAAYLKAAEHAPVTAARWLNRFKQALQTLEYHPTRRGLAPEDELVETEIRQLLFGRGRGASVWRALFTIAGDEVHILHIRRGVRDIATEGDLGA